MPPPQLEIFQSLCSRMGSLIVCGIALVLVLMGIVGFQWGLRRLRIVAVPLAFLLLMVPLPSYLTGQFQWHLKTMAGTVSAATAHSCLPGR